MTSNILAHDFRDQYAESCYPFTDQATLQTTAGLPLSRGVFLDAIIHIPGVITPVYLASITIAPRRITFGMAAWFRGETAAGSFDPTAVPDVVALTDKYNRACGSLVIDPVTAVQLTGWSSARHLFNRDATTFVPSCVIPSPISGLHGLLSPDDELITDDIILVGENGVILAVDTPEAGDPTLTVHIVGDPLFAKAGSTGFLPPRFVRTINRKHADQYGNFVLDVGEAFAKDTVLRINSAGANAIKISSAVSTLDSRG